MSGKKLYRKCKKDYERAIKILHKIENVVKHYDFVRKDDERILKLVDKAKTEGIKYYLRSVSADCGRENWYGCSGCHKSIKKYCTPNLIPSDWGL